MKSWGTTPEIAILAGTVGATALGAVLGFIAIRRQGIYFAMITLGLSQLVYFMCLQSPYSGGEDGIQDVPRGALFGLIPLNNDRVVYAMTALIFLAGFGAIYRIIHSPYGHILKAIADNETRVVSLGYRTDLYKLVAFILSASIAGLAGATKAIVFQLASLADVHWSMSGDAVLMTLVGGTGTFLGPLIGATVIIGIENFVQHLGGWMNVLQGVIFITCVVLMPRGVVGEFLARRRTGAKG
jgi:branched-chain amino acid transport system permease protein